MLAESKFKILNDLIHSSTKDEMLWMHGFLSGVLANPQQEPVSAIKPVVKKITLAYGTESGNSKKLATEFASKAKQQGINAKLVSVDQYRLTDLQKEENFLLIISTQGEGEPPLTAKKFYDYLHQNNLQLPQLKFSILALGDVAYPLFCKAGEDVGNRLLSAGAKQIAPLQKCDVDFKNDAEAWFAAVINALLKMPDNLPQQVTISTKKTAAKKTYSGTILSNINLNDTGSRKQTHHIEIAAEVDYVPGDSIGIVPENPLPLVESIIELTNITREKTITFRNETISVFHLLKNKLNIVHLPERVVKKYAAIVQQNIPETKICLLDLLKIYPVKNALQFEEIIAILEPVTPRLYSISSAPQAHNGEVHITVARDKFLVNDEEKFGVCSNLLVQMAENAAFEFYVHHNNQFRLPESNKDVIMIGAGTGIAPFRSFLAERDVTGATGNNWLFFGDQHFTRDFLYQTEILNWVNTGVLQKVQVAFSRDHQQKIYVQHKMLKQGAAFYNWLQNGAYVFVCGAKKMSADVEKTLLQIIETFGTNTKEQAQNYVDALKAEGRFCKDVY